MRNMKIKLLILPVLIGIFSCSQAPHNQNKTPIKKSQNLSEIPGDKIIKASTSEVQKSDLENLYDKMLENQKVSKPQIGRKISVLLPLSGPQKAIGNSVLDGV